MSCQCWLALEVKRYDNSVYSWELCQLCNLYNTNQGVDPIICYWIYIFEIRIKMAFICQEKPVGLCSGHVFILKKKKSVPWGKWVVTNQNCENVSAYNLHLMRRELFNLYSTLT